MIFLCGFVQASNIAVRLLSKQEWISPSIQEQIAVGLQQQQAKDPLEIINAVIQRKSDQEMFNELDLAKDSFLNELSLDLLKTGIVNNQYAIAVQAHYHYYANYLNDTSCDCWVESAEKRVCNLSDLNINELKAGLADHSKLLDFDLKYDKIPSSTSIAIFYANMRSGCFSSFYKTLKAFSEKDDGFSFVLRFVPPKNTSELEPINISGYGVELALKNTEYHAIDDRVVGSKPKSTEEAKNAEIQSQDILWEEVPSIKPVKKDELPSIAATAIAFAKSSPESLSTLAKVSESFPKVAHLITAAKSEVEDISRASSNLIQTVTGDSQFLLLNGMPLDIERLNVFEILQEMQSENVMIQKLTSIGLTVSQSIEFASEPLQQEDSMSWGDVFDTSSDSVIFLNDIEKDSMYRQFPSSFYALLQPSMPNQFKFVRKNLFTVVLVLDFTNPSHLAELNRVFSILRQRAPMKFGIIPVLRTTDSDMCKLIALSLSLLSSDRQKVEEFVIEIHKSIESGSELDETQIRKSFDMVSGGNSLNLLDRESMEVLQGIYSFNERLGMTKDGVFTPVASDWIQQLAPAYFKMIQYLSMMVVQGEVQDNMEFSIYDHFMTKDSVYHSRNPVIFPKGEIEYVDYPMDVDFGGLRWIDEASETIIVSVIVFSDWSKLKGRKLVLQVLKAIENLSSSRVTFIDSSINGCNEFFEFGYSDTSKLKSFLEGAEKCSKLRRNSEGDEYRANIQAIKSISSFKPGQTGILLNQRKIGPFEDDLSSQDIVTLVSYEIEKRIRSRANFLVDKFHSEIVDHRSMANRILIGTTAMSSKSSLNRIPIAKFGRTKGNSIYFEYGDYNTAHFQFAAAVQPITPTGQKVVSILEKFRLMPGVSIQIFAAGEISEQNNEKLPLLRFYQFVFQPLPLFDTSGKIKYSTANFERLPRSALLTLGMDIPGSWLIRPRKSVYDLDNIKLSNLLEGTNLEAEFTLESLLVQGHAADSATQAPPRGLQFVLGTISNKAMVDTITMANLGYFQLKGGPGVWKLSIRKGRSDEVYQLEEVNRGAKDAAVIVDSFRDITIHPKVSKKVGMKDQDVLDDLSSAGDTGIWGSMTSKLFGSREKSTDETVINVFSVASGHLYERFLAIMMLSVKKATKNPVKFWLIENFLSPSFLEFLPHLSKAFGFDYELVTYKWPHWLRKQTEKQRIIWGYKILFLDVLFPLSLEKVIFVDADQVVRADLRELVDLDLKGAVYGYTPFCSSRTEMDGFRFWKGGYWESHLRGRAYHISALYVIDLVKFRAVAAGDRLRQQYHILSADPNSLSNLDQDLPNNMIHEIPMFSLPQDWLWCETWCSDQSLKTAKTIDLCNNPLTKEPKLDRAKRILPEWEGLDNEISLARDAYLKSATKLTSTADKGAEGDDDPPAVHEEL